jgi:hypothetical protein
MLRPQFEGVVTLLVLAASGAVCAEGIVWDFEGDPLTWRPRADTVSVVLDKSVTASEESKGSLRVSGRIEEGWNYATSDTHPMRAGQLYRLSAWVRVDRLGAGTAAPCLKCEFVGEDASLALGRANTEEYDTARLGAWQLLTGEFRAPHGTVKCWVALEKGGSEPMEIDARLDDVKVEEIDRMSMYDQYRLDPLPEPLARMKGMHPRLYLTQERVAELREAIKTTHKHLWEEVQAQADAAARRGAPKYIEDDGHSGAEQLWQREVGNTLPLLAMAYQMSGDVKYLDAAREWALASCSYPTWGLGSTDGMDLAAGHQLYGLALVYDWCYDDLGDEARSTIRETLVKRTSAMFEAAAGGQAWWRQSYLQNHLWVDVCGMAAAGFALYDEVDDGLLWIGLPLDKFRRTMQALGSDGASHEGAGYWQYGVEYMMKFLHLSGQLLGEDIVGDGTWWPNTARYYQYLTIPRNAWDRRSSLVDLADCPRGNWYGPDHLLRGLAWEYRDGHAQWYADQVDEANIDGAGARWLNLIWFDPSVAPVPPTDMPTLRHFADMDLVSARSDWSGDESLLVFKCGPFIGHEALQRFTYDPGGGHVHPDAGHFVLFGNGEWLLRDDGYRAKWTGQHNTLLVDGRGQLGEGRQWFNGGACLAAKASPRVTLAESSPTLDQIAGDVTQAYPKDSGLTRFTRHLLFIKPDALLALDDVECDADRDLELRFHPEASAAQPAGNAFLMDGAKSRLRVEPLTIDGVAASAEKVGGEERSGGEFAMFTVRLQRRAARWRQATALTWCAAGQEPATVRLDSFGDECRFTVGNRMVRFDWGTGKAHLMP